MIPRIGSRTLLSLPRKPPRPVQRCFSCTAYRSLSKPTAITPNRPSPARSARTPAPARTAATTKAVPKPATPSPPTPNASPSTPSPVPQGPTTDSFTTGLSDSLPDLSLPPPQDAIDWSRSFAGLSHEAFPPEASTILMEPISPDDVEIKPDGIVYLPEIKYRRILNRAFGPGAWGLAPRGETIVTPKSVTREYGLVVRGRLVSIARGEQQYFDPEGIPTATEGCKSNALMRCCKDLGIASELWDPVFIRKYMASHSKEVWVEHAVSKKKKRIIMRKDVKNIPYPYVEVKKGAGGGAGFGGV
ncbi:Mgm101p-domain-containing protein [Trichodelitschia bisporula]|uniref:Mitochondrial genome maintenance protein MGM101 n=1 Tax=Trichodelitschia bisporula TaxID=703511 RepID=A0A6G1HJU1_9PEZI|nr:Mgm101p-domain-containing protein [Trichodelitschia bisporula]